MTVFEVFTVGPSFHLSDQYRFDWSCKLQIGNFLGIAAVQLNIEYNADMIVLLQLSLI